MHSITWAQIYGLGVGCAHAPLPFSAMDQKKRHNLYLNVCCHLHIFVKRSVYRAMILSSIHWKYSGDHSPLVLWTYPPCAVLASKIAHTSYPFHNSWLWSNSLKTAVCSAYSEVQNCTVLLSCDTVHCTVHLLCDTVHCNTLCAAIQWTVLHSCAVWRLPSQQSTLDHPVVSLNLAMALPPPPESSCLSFPPS